MITVQLAFAAALIAALAVTPKVRAVGERFHLTDQPSERKLHQRAVPRIGGAALIAAFLFPFLLLFLLRERSEAAKLVFADRRMPCIFLGAALMFLLGLLDDIRGGLSFRIKFAGQLLAAALLYFCGIRIDLITNPFGGSLELGLLSLPATLFWFVLVINAINLIDGLDGLAAGVCLFASLSMLLVCAAGGHVAPAVAFAALAGAAAGFLRYNFNPASIFMGDSGSYFLGCCLAALSISGTMKGQVATALLMPVIALGVPLIDALWAPVRRFAAGQRLFQPDMRHIHHRLVQLGCTQRKAVLLIYAMTIVLGSCAVILVHSQNETSALILFFMGAAVVAAARLLRLSGLITVRKVSSWARSIGSEMDFSLEGRLFLSRQFEIAQAASVEQLWEEVASTLESLDFDRAEFTFQARPSEECCFQWERGGTAVQRELMLRVELPLHDCGPDGGCRRLGSLLLLKDMSREPSDGNLFKRIGMLRKNMVSALAKIQHSAGGRQKRTLSRSDARQY
jgi:UDP-GlcNAc:undecaprenyl-phosphate GlcNAc-1-phosphate transferase